MVFSWPWEASLEVLNSPLDGRASHARREGSWLKTSNYILAPELRRRFCTFGDSYATQRRVLCRLSFYRHVDALTGVTQNTGVCCGTFVSLNEIDAVTAA